MFVERLSHYLSRESIAALIHSGQRTDHPVYLSDLGAALTSAEGDEQQAVMEEMNVSIDVRLIKSHETFVMFILI
jgi:ATP-dependent Lon protease